MSWRSGGEAGSGARVGNGRRRGATVPVVVGLAVAALVGGCSASAGVGAGSASSGTGASADGAGASSGSASSSGAAAGTVPIGPGPQSSYTVQPQPAAGTCHYRHEGSYPLPDPACTPGATNPAVTAATLATTICRSGGGYTSSIRPPAAVTGREKSANALAYGYTGSFATGEYDHLISLELGGDPNDPRNLWVEPNDKPNATGTTNSKDAVENAAHTAVCTGKLALAQAQQGIATDWPALGRRLGIALP
jgi:hypothetical protein